MIICSLFKWNSWVFVTTSYILGSLLYSSDWYVSRVRDQNGERSELSYAWPKFLGGAWRRKPRKLFETCSAHYNIRNITIFWGLNEYLDEEGNDRGAWRPGRRWWTTRKLILLAFIKTCWAGCEFPCAPHPLCSLATIQTLYLAGITTYSSVIASFNWRIIIPKNPGDKIRWQTLFAPFVLCSFLSPLTERIAVSVFSFRLLIFIVCRSCSTSRPPIGIHCKLQYEGHRTVQKAPYFEAICTCAALGEFGLKQVCWWAPRASHCS